MIARESDGKFITQRQVPSMALIEVDIPQEALMCLPLAPGAALILTAPGVQPLKVRAVPAGWEPLYAYVAEIQGFIDVYHMMRYISDTINRRS